MTCEFIECEQGSAEWHDLRRHKIGASNVASICGFNPYRSARDVFGEMTRGEQVTCSEVMLKGMQQEPIAREWFNQYAKDSNGLIQTVTPKVAVNAAYPYLMASLDGISEDGQFILEIKRPGQNVWTLCKNGKIPIYWQCQIQTQMMVTEAKEALLLVWKSKKTQLFWEYKPDANMIHEITERCSHFYYNHLLRFNPPNY